MNFVTLPNKPSVIYVCCASLDAIQEDGSFSSFFLMYLAALTTAFPQHVFLSPLLNHAFAKMMPEVELDYEAWKERCRLLVSRCDAAILFDLPHWQQSVGVKDELALLDYLSKPVSLFSEQVSLS